MKKVIAEIRRTIKNPKRITKIRKALNRAYLKQLVTGKGKWEVNNANGLKSRKYNTYDEYVEHQKSKLEIRDVTKTDQLVESTLTKRFAESEFVTPGKNVLCLGARLGGEVRAFISNGCFAIGIDLNPGKRNRYVVEGDFHNVQYADNSIDLAYSNCLDHCFDIDKVVQEIARVLKPNGHAILDSVVDDDDDDRDPGEWASFWWEHPNDLVKKFVKYDFEEVARKQFSDPWKGTEITLRRKL